jgi:hypothetical protein
MKIVRCTLLDWQRDNDIIEARNTKMSDKK